MPPFIDLTGKTFGRLTVLKRVDDDKNRNPKWLCVCSCPDKTERVVYGVSLREGATTSCGCYHREVITTHGGTDDPEFTVWQMIIQRCTNPNHTSYPSYGGRKPTSITICDEWLNDYRAFKDHVKDRPSDEHTLERKNNDGNYEPGNVKWATPLEQGCNKRNNVFLEKDGERLIAAEWSRRTGLSITTILRRKAKGLTDEEALEIVDRRRKH